MMHSSERLKEAKSILAAQLRQIRNEACLTGQALASEIGWPKSKVSKIENANQVPTEGDIREWCRVCNADDQTVDLIAAVRNIDSMYIQWRRLEQTGLRHVQQSFMSLYRSTSQLRVFQHAPIPGLLQTPDYAAAHLRCIMEFREIPNDLDQAVEERVALQEVLRDGAKRFAFIFGEQALYARMCGPAAMVAQLERLTATTYVPNVSLGVLPIAAPRTVWPWEGFWIYDADQVRCDTLPGQIRNKQPTDVAIYEKAFTALAESAVYGEAARELIAAASAGFQET